MEKTQADKNNNGVWGLKVKQGLFSDDKLTKLFNRRVRRRVKAHKRWTAMQIYALEQARKQILDEYKSYSQVSFGGTGDGPKCNSPECVIGHMAWALHNYKKDNDIYLSAKQPYYSYSPDMVGVDMDMTGQEGDTIFSYSAESWPEPFCSMYSPHLINIMEVYRMDYEEEANILRRKMRAKVAGMYITHILTTGEVTTNKKKA